VEFHYYLVLPLFLWLLTKSKLWPLSIVVAAIALRWFLHHERGEIQSLAFWTIIGRIDQFALGMLVYQFRSHLARRHVVAAATIIAFMMFYWYFDHQGGFFQNPSYPSPRPIWIVLPTLEGLAYATGIAWSYSIYLLHFFVVFDAARFVNQRIMDISNFYLACLWSTVFFLLMMLPGYVSFRFIEAPFLKLRKPYFSKPQEALGQAAQQSAP